MDLAKKVVDKMISGDAFSQWLGIEVLEITEGFCKLKMTVIDEMTNGFNIAHGGIAYSLADSCLAFAANSYAIQALTLETSINYSKVAESGDVLTAVSKKIFTNEKHFKSGKLAKYDIVITNQNSEEIAHFTGIVYITGKEWFPKN